MSNDYMKKEQFEQSLESQIQLARPRRGEVERVPLTPEEKEFLGEIMKKAVAAEKAGELEKALGYYTEYRDELLKIKEKKEGEKTFELKEQYEDQVETLKKNGLIEELPSGELGFFDINGKPRRIPTYEEILERVKAKKEFFEKKREQGFTQLLLVPFGMKLSEMIDRVMDLILKKNREGKLKSTNGNELKLNEEEPVWMAKEYQSGNVDVSGNLVYYPEKFDRENHGGKTKQEILEEELEGANIGWDIMLIEDLPDLLTEGEGTEVGGRKQLEANQTPEQYLEMLQKEEQYQGEQGMTPEAELTYFMHYLQKNNKVIDDWKGSGKINWNLGGYLKHSGDVCLSRWHRYDSRQLHLGWDLPSVCSDYYGVRVGVRI